MQKTQALSQNWSPSVLQLYLVSALAVLLTVRIVALGFNETDLFFDEAQYWSWSLEPAFGYYSKPPLIAWIIGGATAMCGTSEFCVRLPAPIIHTLTALCIFALASRLYDRTVGLWSALVFATLPGISFSAGIISTDVPLLACWALALYGLAGIIENRGWAPAFILGLAFGAGLNAKYAMAYFVLCLAIYLAATPERRWLIRDKRLWAALALGALLIAPNLIWNVSNQFATFAHTADNAKWGGALFHPGKAIEFFLAQFGVFGPILFASLLLIGARAYQHGVPQNDRLLLAFSVPVIAVVLAQALVSRAHANWAAIAYVAATILVTATLLREARTGWLRVSFALHVAVLAIFAVATANATRLTLPGIGAPFARTMGWRGLAAETQAVLEQRRAMGQPIKSIITDDRATTAELLYYLRGSAGLLRAWRGSGRPQDHYELTRAFATGSPEPVLLVALRPQTNAITSRFSNVIPVVTRDIPTGPGQTRRATFIVLSGFRGP